MDRKKTIRNNIIVIAIVAILVFFVAFVNDTYHGTSKIYMTILFYFIGAIVWGLINALIHELGHVIAGNKNNFLITCVTVWFFKWVKLGKKFRFHFTTMKEQAGFTESVPMSTDNLDKRVKKMAFGGILASGILTLLSFVPLFLCGFVPYWLYSILAIALPISGFYFFGNVIPTISEGVRNDGAMIMGINKGDDDVKVMLSLLKINAELYSGKTYAEIDKDFYFDLPQLPEDSPYFISLLFARYNYFVDIEDFENAKKVNERLVGLADDLPNETAFYCKINSLYEACTYNFDEEKADDYMYEVENILNSSMSPTFLRVKLAYVLYVSKDVDLAKDFYNKCISVCKKFNISGLANFELKLLERMSSDI